MEITLNQFDDLLVDGRPTYQLSDEDLLTAFDEVQKGEDAILKATFARLVAARLERYTRRKDESKDACIGRIISDFTNGRITSMNEVAESMGRQHRYLQGEMFTLVTAYIKVLAQAYDNKRYDARNEYACKKAKQIVDACFEVSPNGTLY